MQHAALESFMHALMWKAVPILILGGAVGLLVREALLRFERNINRGLESHRSGEKKDWAQYIPANHSDKSQAPRCGACGVPMEKREADRGGNGGSQVWGCSNYPKCRETRAITKVG